MRRWAGMGVAILALAGVLAPAAAHGFGIEPGDGGFRGSVFSSGAGSDIFAPDGEDETRAFTVDGVGIYDQAGGHPFKGITDFVLTGTIEDNVENLRVDIPPGLVPNPNAFAKCSEAALEASTCPVAAQIGTEELRVSVSGITLELRVPLYNVEPRPSDVARFGFNPADAAAVPGIGALAAALDALHPVHIVGGVRDSAAEANPPGSDPLPMPADHGLFFTISDIPASLALLRSKLTFWGAPGAAEHDAQRRQSCVLAAILPIQLCGLALPAGGPDPSLPFLTNPTSCTGQKLTARLIVNSHAGATANRIDQTPTLPNADGIPSEGAQRCDLVPFAAEIDVDPGVGGPDAPAGPRVTLTVPQPGLADQGTLTTAHVRNVSVTLPPGMTINPSAANGLAACTDAQLATNAGVPGGDACPAASDVGDATVSSPLLPDALTGDAHVGQPLPGDRYRLFVTLEGRGVSIRLVGSVRPDPVTGQLTAHFVDNPELPFGELAVDFDDGPRAVLATPPDCGAKVASANLAPWSGNAAATPASAPFEISGAGCPPGFEPAFGAATADGSGGAFAPLTVAFGRGDRNQFLSGVRVDTPPGLAARIRGVEKCSDAAANAGTCPAATRIGTATTAAGAGPEPYRLSGPVYFTEGHRGAPFGMVAVIRAVAGPFDLGTVVVRQAIYVDPEDASLTVVSDPLPQILEGVPIRLREVAVTLDRPRFVYNPTSCGDKGVGGRLTSAAGATVDRAATLAIAGCDRLGFAPKMRMALLGPRQMAPSRHPGLRVTLTQPDGQANISGAVVKLPRSLALDPANAQAVCGFEAGLRAVCPKASRIGTAVAHSPALNRQLRGPVYFVQGIRIDPTTGARIRTLPSLLAKLGGEIRLNLRGVTDVEGGRLVSTFGAIPDAPVSRFVMRLKGGRGGVLAATGRPRICGRRQVSANRLAGHNGKVAPQRRVGMVKPCRRPALKLRRLRATGKRLVVRGAIARKATGRIAVTARCGKARSTRRAKRPRKGRWAVAMRLPRACAAARRTKVRIAYSGGGAYRARVLNRQVTLRGGS